MNTQDKFDLIRTATGSEIAKDAMRYFYLGDNDKNGENNFASGFYRNRETDNRMADSLLHVLWSEALLDRENWFAGITTLEEMQAFIEDLSGTDEQSETILDS